MLRYTRNFGFPANLSEPYRLARWSLRGILPVKSYLHTSKNIQWTI